VIMAIALWVSRPQPGPAPEPSPAQAGQAPSIAEPIVPPVLPPPAVAVPAGPRQAAAPSPSPVPEVVVSPSESAGLRFLLSALREGRLDPGALPADLDETGSAMPIVIEPITVEPLVAAADLESGVSQ
jgi:hypothetical protein